MRGLDLLPVQVPPLLDGMGGREGGAPARRLSPHAQSLKRSAVVHAVQHAGQVNVGGSR